MEAVQPARDPEAFTPSHKLSSVVNLVKWPLRTRLPATGAGAPAAAGLAGAGVAAAAGLAGAGVAAAAGAAGLAGLAGAGVAGAWAKAVTEAPESAQRTRDRDRRFIVRGGW